MTEPAVDRNAGRYARSGGSALPRRLIAIVLAALGIALAVAVGVLAYQRFSAADVEGSLGGYEVIDDETVSVTISVTRSDPSRPVVCIARARAKDGSESGRREVLVAPSQDATVQVTTVVKSSKPPVMGDVYGCGTEVPSYLHSR